MKVSLERLLVFDPATLYESAGKIGMVDPRIRPAWPGARICGVALTVESPPGDNLMLHQAVAIASPGAVIVANTGEELLRGAWGEILTVAAQARHLSGLVIDGAVRDIEAITSRAFPVFSRGMAIGACTKQKLGKLNATIQFGGVLVRPGDVVFGNADGLVVLEQKRIDQIYDAAVKRQQEEAEMMEQLCLGKTTLELLGLPGAPKQTGVTAE